jgi:hypothetical protein
MTEDLRIRGFTIGNEATWNIPDGPTSTEMGGGDSPLARAAKVSASA